MLRLAGRCETGSNGFDVQTAPITSADIVGGIFGAGINLEPDGPGTGTATGALNLTTYVLTTTALTGVNAPTPGFTGDVFGLSLVTNGTTSPST